MRKNSYKREPIQARARGTVEAILEAAAHILVADGYEALTTNHVARVAGVSIGSLYQYFPDKQAILRTLVERHVQDILGDLGRAVFELAELPLEEAVPKYIRAMIEAHQHNPELHRVCTRELPSIGGFDIVRRSNEEASRLIRAYLERHRARIRPKNVDLAVFVLVTSVEAVTHAAILDETPYARTNELADEVSELVLGYLGVRRTRAKTGVRTPAVRVVSRRAHA